MYIRLGAHLDNAELPDAVVAGGGRGCRGVTVTVAIGVATTAAACGSKRGSQLVQQDVHQGQGDWRRCIESALERKQATSFCSA